MKTILVTGGAGFIGSHTCKSLAANGYLPVAYDNLVTGHRDLVKWGPLVQGDIADYRRLDSALKEYKPEAVIHFAACAYVGESVQHPRKYYRNNIAGSLALLEALVDNGVNKMVFSSSCATYGHPETPCLMESHPQAPVNPYGYTKLVTERMLNDFDRAYGLQSIALRYFNAAGADPDGETGEDHEPETHLIPLVLDVAAGLSEHITIFGNDYDTPDGTCIRDYIHVSDLADAHVLALRLLGEGGRSDCFNLGNGTGFSVMDIVKAAETVLGVRIPYRITQRRPGDPDRLVSDPRKAAESLGWRPHHGSIEAIIRHAWEWRLQRHGNLSSEPRRAVRGN